MSLIGRYIFRQIIFAAALTLITLVVLLWLSQALSQVRLVMAQGQTLMLFLKVTSLALPALIVVIAPVALVIAIVHVLNRLNNDSELVVVTAAGAPRMQVVAPVMLAASLVMVLTAILSLYLQPLATRQFRTIMTQVKADMIASMAQEGQFTRIDKLTLHIQARDPDGTLRGLMLHDMRDPERVSTYLAERGRIIEENGTPFLVMENGNLQRAGDTPESITMVAFNRYVFDLSQFTERQNVSEYHSRERSTFELLFPDTSEPYYQENEGRFRAELHERVSAILYPIAFAAIALATIGFARTSREGRSKLIFVAIVWIVGLRILGFAAMNLSRQEVWPVFLMYALPLSAIALALSIAFGRTRKLQDIWLRLWNRIPFAVIAQRTGLTSAGDFLRPKWQAVLRNAGLSG
ncbi:MAG: LPS export ABC transporter permease LptF [Rhodobiaceae bacterium]|nr:LPS export ABC transporter permease LptF [Rhodobiaceae bacterium]MCC0050032.1 LPS export ABC transporter permease LptF [Rhodobiaceae bacterium]